MGREGKIGSSSGENEEMGPEQMVTRVTRYPQNLREIEFGPRSLSVIPYMSSSSHEIYEVYDVSFFCVWFF